MSELVKTDEKLMAEYSEAVKALSRADLINNVLAVFDASSAVIKLRQIFSDEFMKQRIIPLMNSRVGFMTDRNGRPNQRGETKPLYTVDVIRDALIDATGFGLMPTGNQFNIIGERMYPTKEGFTALLQREKIKYMFSYGADVSKVDGRAEIHVQINYEHNGLKNSFTSIANVKKDSYSSYDNLKGKAERHAKKVLYEYITGCDFGDTEDVEAEDVSDKKNQQPKINIPNVLLRQPEKQAAQEQKKTPPSANGNLF
jgi:hypothetical protein